MRPTVDQSDPCPCDPCVRASALLGYESLISIFWLSAAGRSERQPLRAGAVGSNGADNAMRVGFDIDVVKAHANHAMKGADLERWRHQSALSGTGRHNQVGLPMDGRYPRGNPFNMGVPCSGQAVSRKLMVPSRWRQSGIRGHPL